MADYDCCPRAVLRVGRRRVEVGRDFKIAGEEGDVLWEDIVLFLVDCLTRNC